VLGAVRVADVDESVMALIGSFASCVDNEKEGERSDECCVIYSVMTVEVARQSYFCISQIT